jgi:hypothetical protein
MNREKRGIVSYLMPIGFMVGFLMACVFGEDIYQIKTNARRMIIANDLRLIALAMHSYHEKHGRLPPAVVRSVDGAPLYSWRVLLLPYLEQEALYAQFHLDEPWDSPHNLPLLNRIPRVYRPEFSATPDPSMTFYQVFVGPGSAFEGDKGLQVPDDFPDGANKTILVVEARTAVPWTKPEDIPFGRDLPLPEFGSPRRGRFGRLETGEYIPVTFYAALVDASVDVFEVGVSPWQIFHSAR